MQKFMVVLFNLKPGASADEYEAFAASEDMPEVKKLSSVTDMAVNRIIGTMDGTPPPYQYAEIITISDFDKLGSEAQSDKIQEIAGKFMTFADKPVFLLLEQFC
ncbi:MAG: REDY-like protein HapK [Alphaproteobacteria bacterium]